MSAIVGICHLNDEPIDIEQGKNVMKVLQKFPADDIQAWHNERIFLGCHAQWITPESVGELLPYYDHNRKLAITADAIIDNRDELFERLQVSRDRRKAISDSELILLSYDKWGEESPKYLVGDFAFMIWDEGKQKLFGARDFSGSRTLYYYQDSQRFVFSTIIDPLFTLPYVQKELDEKWLAEFLAISSVIDTVSTDITIYKNIGQLPPSHSISVSRGKVKLSRYCKITTGEQLKLKSNDEYVEAFRDVFQTAVSSRLRTNRSVGSHLSGGLDSGAVVSFAVKALREENKKLHTFSYIPPKDFIDFTPKYRLADEREYIESTVKYVGGISDHLLDFYGKNPFAEVDDFLETMEMPYKFFENSVWLKGIFEKAHEEGIGVLLNGGRGNMTISWGPALEYYAVLLRRLKWIRLSHEIDHYSKNYGVGKSRVLSYVGKMTFPFLNRISQSIVPYQSRVLINSEFANKTGVFNRLKEHGINEQVHSFPDLYKEKKRHFEELFHWNATNTLGTKLSLRYSIWKRDPTNDLRVIRFCLSVPEEQYVQNGLDRALIRRSTEQFIPDKVRLNQKFRGVQGVDWVHRMAPTWNTFVDELKELKTSSEIFQYLDPIVVKAAISKVEDGPKPEYAIDPDYRIAIRSLIVYRFLKNNFS